MLSIYQRWHYADTKIREGVPYDEVLGNSRHELERKFYTAANLAPVAARIDAWLTSWRFKGLVELYPLNDPQGFSAWSFMFWEITRIVFKHTFISAPDCLHAAATLVLGADLFVSNDGGLKTALRKLYDSAALKAEAASVLGILPADITLPHGALKVKDALDWAKRQ